MAIILFSVPFSYIASCQKVVSPFQDSLMHKVHLLKMACGAWSSWHFTACIQYLLHFVLPTGAQRQLEAASLVRICSQNPDIPPGIIMSWFGAPALTNKVQYMWFSEPHFLFNLTDNIYKNENCPYIDRMSGLKTRTIHTRCNCHVAMHTLFICEHIGSYMLCKSNICIMGFYVHYLYVWLSAGTLKVRYETVLDGRYIWCHINLI